MNKGRRTERREVDGRVYWDCYIDDVLIATFNSLQQSQIWFWWDSPGDMHGM